MKTVNVGSVATRATKRYHVVSTIHAIEIMPTLVAVSWCSVRNWLKIAKKNAAILGLKKTIKNPSRACLKKGWGVLIGHLGLSLFRVLIRLLKIDLNAIHKRKPNPATWRIKRVPGELRSMVSSPVTTRHAYIRMPAPWAMLKITPAVRPSMITLRISKARLGPGLAAPAKQANNNNIHSLMVMIALTLVSADTSI